MSNSISSEIYRWLRLLAEVLCDFIFLGVWALMAVALHHLMTGIWLLEGWSRHVQRTMEVVVDISTLIKLLRLRFAFRKTRDEGPWWR